jgi:hypothetical protein
MTLGTLLRYSSIRIRFCCHPFCGLTVLVLHRDKSSHYIALNYIARAFDITKRSELGVTRFLHIPCHISIVRHGFLSLRLLHRSYIYKL